MNALIVVDIQNDFLPGGALAVPHGDDVVPVIDALLPAFDHVVATQDWHPANHMSFAVNQPGHVPGDVIEVAGLRQELWPPHCVQGTPGAEFAPGLDRGRFETVIRKGQDPTIDSYSTFFDNAHRRDTGLDAWLRARGIDEVFLAGLALDYCVRYSALDARGLGYRVTVIVDACRGIELFPGDIARALRDMERAGVTLAHASDFLRKTAPPAAPPTPAPPADTPESPPGRG